MKEYKQYFKKSHFNIKSDKKNKTKMFNLVSLILN